VGGRLRKNDTSERDNIETAQAALSGMLVHVDECILRSHQAMQRSSLVIDVLEPAIRRLEAIRSELRLAQKSLNAVWLKGQERKWRRDEAEVN